MDVFGRNIAHYSAEFAFNFHRSYLMIKLLVAHSFLDFNMSDGGYRTPLCYAARSCSVELLNLLLKYGADLASHNRVTHPLHEAAWAGNIGVVQFLLDSGVPIELKDKVGYTPLHWAAFYGMKEVCVLLLQRGADVNAQDYGSATPLHEAVSKDDATDCFQVLLEYGADPHIVGWSSGSNLKALRFEAPISLARRKEPATYARYMELLRDFYPDIFVDEEGEVFWDALEDGAPGYGSSYDSAEACK